MFNLRTLIVYLIEMENTKYIQTLCIEITAIIDVKKISPPASEHRLLDKSCEN